jgi:hypothetical protein
MFFRIYRCLYQLCYVFYEFINVCINYVMFCHNYNIIINVMSLINIINNYLCFLEYIYIYISMFVPFYMLYMLYRWPIHQLMHQSMLSMKKSFL